MAKLPEFKVLSDILENQATIRRELLEVMVKQEISGRELAEELHMSYASINNFLQGKSVAFVQLAKIINYIRKNTDRE